MVNKFYDLILNKYPDKLSCDYLSIDLLPNVGDYPIEFGYLLKRNMDMLCELPEHWIFTKCGYKYEIREYRFFLILSDEWTKVKRDIKLNYLL